MHTSQLTFCLVLAVALLPVAVDAQGYPAAATSAKETYDNAVASVNGTYQQKLAEIQAEYNAKLTAAQEEFNTGTASATTNYIDALKDVITAETNAGNATGAGQVQATLYYATYVPQRTPVQQHWIASFAAEAQGDFKGAIDSLMKVFQVEGAEPNTFSKIYANVRLGKLYSQLGDYDTAIQVYQNAFKASPKATGPLAGLVYCYQAKRAMAQDTDAAVANERLMVGACQQILALDPVNYLANKTLGDLAFAKKDYKSAGGYFRKLAATNPEDLEAMHSLAWCYVGIGLPKPAQQMFTTVLEVNPDHALALQGFQATIQAQQAAAAAAGTGAQ